MRKIIALALGGVAFAIATAAPSSLPARGPVPTSTNPQFCSDIQRVLTGTSLVARNPVHTDFDAFVKSKPQISPLTTQQWVEYADAAKILPMLVACKTKSADHLLAVHGPGSALDDLLACQDVNRSIVNGAWAAMTPGERRAASWPPTTIMLDADEVGFLGSEFIKPYTFLYLGADRRPHILAIAQYAG